jgi:hypothetical protein
LVTAPTSRIVPLQVLVDRIDVNLAGFREHRFKEFEEPNQRQLVLPAHPRLVPFDLAFYKVRNDPFLCVARVEFEHVEFVQRPVTLLVGEFPNHLLQRRKIARA